jgi:hypothetical protein
VGDGRRTACTVSVPLIVLSLLQDQQTPADVTCSGSAGLAALQEEMDVLLEVGTQVSPSTDSPPAHLQPGCRWRRPAVCGTVDHACLISNPVVRPSQPRFSWKPGRGSLSGFWCLPACLLPVCEVAWIPGRQASIPPNEAGPVCVRLRVLAGFWAA